MSKEFKKFLEPNHIVSSIDEGEEAFGMIADGLVDNEDIKSFLVKINELRDIPDSSYFYFLHGAAYAFKKRMVKIKAPKNTMDVCGTGGDGLNTLNISTAVAFVVAACGVPVAKHGNKAVSSLSGSADIFSALGIDINLSKEKAEECLEKNNLVFLFAPLYHPAFKNVAQARKELGIRTIFNYLGPLLNPAEVKYQLIGCSNANDLIISRMILTSWCVGCKNFAIVYGDDGMDEISIVQNSNIITKPQFEELFNKKVLNPEDYGFKKAPSMESIRGGSPQYNAEKLLNLLNGGKSFYRDVVILNAAYALVVADKVYNFKEGIKEATKAIDNEDALKVLENLQKFNK